MVKTFKAAWGRYPDLSFFERLSAIRAMYRQRRNMRQWLRNRKAY